MGDQVFNYLIIGRGMMGAAAARHLADASDGVALLGPDEPAEKATHQGVFGSHYDEARITRTIDPDPVWAKLAHRSIARYGEIEQASGIRFYHEAGCLIVGPKPVDEASYVTKVARAASALGVSTESLSPEQLQKRFGYFSFGSDAAGIYEARHAGYVNPRRLVEAQSLLVERAGVRLIRQTAVTVRDEGTYVAVETDRGETLRARKVLVAAGGFSIADRLLPKTLDLAVYARTVAFFEIAEDQLAHYQDMPSLIHEADDPKDHIYLLPPVRYPDGKTYLKIGGDPDDLKLITEPDIRDWFRSGGRTGTRDHLAQIIGDLVPSLSHAPLSMAACVTSFTPTGYPAIGWSDSPRIGVLAGGCGAAAKSSDEIGRMGAMLLLNGSIADQGYAADFAPRFLG
ncbi:FAD-dependent oxidoreductase [Allorhizobium sp. BGMRC 0089]|uniref:NAD(P)/FAD-dependent oxidoreductase n=1 Tax=Allorhizobium sonneratiae TaxID=2934936 RepID=UPI0020333498|nr:FAD-dependent oxidoreductase [Allorhizobium sonneratiae]MCM2294203.1 FAD-dependent oxidoreductase [Allorhizobium sonneratiae]